MVARYFLCIALPNVLDVIIDLAEDKVKNVDQYRAVKRRALTQVLETPPSSVLETPPSSDPESQKAQHFKELVSQPRSLFSLSRQAVCQSMGPMPERRSKVQQLAVPDIVKQNLCVDDLDLKFARHGENLTFQMIESCMLILSTRILGFEIDV